MICSAPPAGGGADDDDDVQEISPALSDLTAGMMSEVRGGGTGGGGGAGRGSWLVLTEDKRKLQNKLKV